MNRTIIKPFILILTIYLSGISCAMSQDSPVPSLSIYTGNMSGEGNVDGALSMASFRSPQTLTVDGAGNIYIVDGDGNNTIRKISKEGVVTTLAGTKGKIGRADGHGENASFNKPRGITLDAQGNVYVADSWNHTVRKINPAGMVTTLAGTGSPDTKDGEGVQASLFIPSHIALDTQGNIYVDSGFCIRKISPSGVVTTLAGDKQEWPSVNGKGREARFSNINGLTIDRQGNLYVTEFHDIRKVSPDGVVTTINVKYGPSEAKFSALGGIAADAEGNLFVLENQTIRKISADGNVTTIAGVADKRGNMNGRGKEARWGKNYSDLVIDSFGNLFFADSENHSIRKVTRDGTVSTVGGKSTVATRVRAEGEPKLIVNRQSRMIPDRAGNLYVSLRGDIYKITPDGGVTRRDLRSLNYDLKNIGAMFFAPDETLYFINDGINFSRDSGAGGPGNWLGLHGSGSASSGYVSVYKLSADNSVKRVAGESADVTTGGLVIDTSGELYVAGYSTIKKIKQRRLLPAKIVPFLKQSTVNHKQDGVDDKDQLGIVTGVAIDGSDNLYVSDRENSSILKISPSGIISPLAGAGIGSPDNAARLEASSDLVIDASGNLYTIDALAQTVNKITPTGEVSILVGDSDKRGFQGGPLPGIISRPQALAIYGKSLYILMAGGSVSSSDWREGAATEGLIAVVKNLP